MMKTAVTLLVTLALLAGSARILPILNDMRRESHLTFEEPLQGVPPILVVTTTALGCFRGIIANLLWLRATALKEEGKYFEHMQLSDWICKLAPRFPMVWAHRAWDMAYNISVELPTAEERWRWVSRGIELLRDDGIRYNPSSAEIHKELAWIYFHKVGGISDDMHWYYKQKLLEQMMDVLGSAEPDLESIASAPRTYGDLLEDEEVRVLVEKFDGLEVDLADSFFDLIKGEEDMPAPALNLFVELRDGGPMKRLEAYCRARRLREEFKLEPEEMIALMEEYGPLDWRCWATHSLYWIKRGLEHAPEDSTINYDRIAYFSIQDIVRKGRINLVEHDGKTLLLTSPDYRFAGAMERIFKKNIEHYEKEGGGVTGMKAAYNYFLQDVIWNSYFSDQMSKAAEFYKKRFPERPVSPRILRDFVQDSVRENIKNSSRHESVRTIEILLEQMWFSYAAENDNDAVSFENYAKLIHDSYSREQENSGERMGLPPFAIMKRGIRERILRKEFLARPFPLILLDNLKGRLRVDSGPDSRVDSDAAGGKSGAGGMR